MPNGGDAVPANDLGTYRKSEVAQLEASHARLLEACKVAVGQPAEGPNLWAIARNIGAAVERASGARGSLPLDLLRQEHEMFYSIRAAIAQAEEQP